MRWGLRLLLLHPRVAARPCEECRSWLYDDRGSRLERGGRPVPRPANAPTPCKSCPKIPPGEPPAPESAVELDGQLRQAYEFYRECRAVGQFPNDPLVRWVARVARDVEDAAEKAGQGRAQAALLGRILGG